MQTSPSMHELARTLHDLQTAVRRIKAGSTSPQLSSSSLEDGAIPEFDAAGKLVGRIGKQPDGSHTHAVLDGPTPTQSTAPLCTALALEIETTWDGNLADPTVGLYADFEAVEVHVGTTLDFAPTSATLRGEIRSRAGGSIGVPAAAGLKWVRLVIRSQAAKHGPASVAVEVDVPPLVDTAQFEALRTAITEAEQALADAQEGIAAALEGDVDLERIALGSATAREAVVGQLAAQLANIIEANIGNLTVTEGAQINELVAQAIAAQTAEFIRVKADYILAGELTALVRIKTDGALVIGSEDQPHIVQKDGAITFYLPGEDQVVGVDPVTGDLVTETGDPRPILQIGKGAGNYWQTVDLETGAVLSQIDESGNVTGIVGAFESLSVDDRDPMAELDGLESRLKMYSKEQSNTKGPYDEPTGLWEWEFDVLANHRYIIQFAIEAETTGSNTYNGFTLHKTETAPGGSPAAPLASGSIFGRLKRLPATAAVYEGTYTWFFQPNASERARFLLACRAPGNSTIRVNTFNGYCLDMGVTPENTGRASLGGASGSIGGGSTTPDPVAPKEDKVKTYSADYGSHQGWTQYAKNTYKTSLIRSGRIAGSNSSRNRTYLALPSALRTKLSSLPSADIRGLLLRVTVADRHVTDGDVWIGTTTTSNIKQSSEPTSANYAQASRDYREGKAYWLEATSSQLAAIRSGAKGFVIGRDATSDYLVDFVGTTSGTSTRPAFRLEYRE